MVERMSALRSLAHRLAPRAEELGIQPVPQEHRTGTWLDLFAINFAFGINPLYFVMGAIGVTTFDLPLWWAVAGLSVAQLISYVILATVAHLGCDYGIPGQVGMRAFLGFWGARGLSSGYRTVAALYWFAVQAVTTAFAVQALAEALAGWHLRVVPIALVLGAFHALLAVLGFDVLRYATKVILPLAVVFLVVIITLYMRSNDPRFAVGHVFDSPGHHLTWVHFSAYVTLVIGSQLTFLPSIADFSRYTRSRRDSDIGLYTSAMLSAVIVTFVGGFGAVAVGAVKNPFEIGAGLTSSKVVLAFLLLAVIVQSTGVNIINAYNVGMSLANAVPRLGRILATAIGAVVAVALSSQPDLLTSAADWITNLGNVSAPLAGAVMVDYLVVKRQRIDVAGLYDPRGPYRYLFGVNLAAAVAIAVAIVVYYVMPHAESKAAWGFGVAAALYWVLSKVQQRLPALAGASTNA